jgi:DNA polymerase III sliding clamp (beta) subunit (PCNA family)
MTEDRSHLGLAIAMNEDHSKEDLAIAMNGEDLEIAMNADHSKEDLDADHSKEDLAIAMNGEDLEIAMNADHSKEDLAIVVTVDHFEAILMIANHHSKTLLNTSNAFSSEDLVADMKTYVMLNG